MSIVAYYIICVLYNFINNSNITIKFWRKHQVTIKLNGSSVGR